MAETATIARPYAEAVFRLADDGGKLAEWSSMLGDLAAVASDGNVRVAINDPKQSPARVAGLFISILTGRLSGDGENLVRVLAENRRLEVLPEIRSQYESLRNERENVVDAEIYSAFELDDTQVAQLVAGLERKTGHKVMARVELDKELLGGVKIVIGDKVIDASARGQLAALESALKA